MVAHVSIPAPETLRQKDLEPEDEVVINEVLARSSPTLPFAGRGAFSLHTFLEARYSMPRAT